MLADAIGRLADREGAVHVVDVGCGRGELLAHLAAARPDLRLTGVDVVARPEGLAPSVGWMTSPGGGALPEELTDLEDVLVVAHEWLDVVPCPVLEVDDGGRARVVLVDVRTGTEELSGDVEPEDLAWCAAHWPLDGLPAGARVEVGRSRDRAWSDLVAAGPARDPPRGRLRPHP